MKPNLKLLLNKAQSRLTNNLRTVVLAGVACVAGVQPTYAQTVAAAAQRFVAPTVFQAAGTSAASIQSTVDQFRAALGVTNNGNNPGQASGRREINWDGGSPTNAATSLSGTPLTAFLNTRGANITTRGSGFVQAPASGLADTFGNSSYATIFHAFSPLRLFSPIGSNVTVVEFAVPGSNGNTPATTTGFGVVFTDVDSPDGSRPDDRTGNRHASTVIEYFGTHGELLFKSFAPASPGDGNLSFLGVVFDDARIARVKIIAGDAAPGANDGSADIVMMDDFLYGEPTALY
ncbi:MAG TPA: hypothetical protein VK198_06810 [Terriglobales bacterium]|nr:hypothetical protein [Terriglobales bacterium]